jgi:hypothetical protein
VAQWIEAEMNGRIYLKELMRYTDDVLEFEVRKAVLIHNIKYVFYDTLKNSVSGQWEYLKITTNKLKQLANELKIYMYSSIQLTDDTNFVEPLQLSSLNISEAKHLKHILDGLILCKQISRENYHKYVIVQEDENWGEDCPTELKYSKNYYCFVIDKNRRGSKTAIAFSVDLDLNIWHEEGRLVKKSKE